METNKEKALHSLQGVAVGDALGEMFFGPPQVVLPKIEKRILPDGIWEYTDDTEMTISIVDTLFKFEHIDQSYLARQFAERMTPYRGYGKNTYELLEYIKLGMHWKEASYNAFRGKGSFGNGAAMRSSPIGAFFYNDIDALINNARDSAEVTHAHPEGIAGAIAIALAASYACNITNKDRYNRLDYYQYIVDHMPESIIRNSIAQLKNISAKDSIRDIVNILGNGYDVSAQDTVPFVIWSSSLYLFNIEDAFWYTVEGLGDRDTTCAMVCGIVALSTEVPIPEAWLVSCETLPSIM